MSKAVIATIIASKIVIFTLIFFAYSFFPFNTFLYHANFFYLPKEANLQAAYSTWDAQHYLFLSEQGYHKGNDSNAFSPLFPFTIHLATYLTHSSFWSGLLLSNAFSFIACILFYTFVRRITSEKIAFASLCTLLAFPTSFYFSLIYTESLFFLLVMIFFWALFKNKLWIVSFMAFLIPLSRLIGTAIFLPFLFSYVLEMHGHNFYDEVTVIAKTLFQKKTLLILSSIVGLGATMVWMYISTGSFFAQFDALQNFVSHHSVTSVINPIFFLRELFTFPLSLHGYTNSLIDRLFFIAFLALLPLLFRRVSFTLSVFAVVFGIVPVLSGSFMSYTRYLVVVFPIFITLGKMSQEKKYSGLVFPLLFLSIMLQALFIIMQSLNYWVS